jgi:hypothetical protein
MLILKNSNLKNDVRLYAGQGEKNKNKLFFGYFLKKRRVLCA